MRRHASKPSAWTLVAPLLLAICPSGHAQDAAALVSCEPAADRVVIRYFPSATEQDAEQHADLVAFWSLLDFERCAAEHPFAGDPCTVTGNRDRRFVCALSKVRYEVTLIPGVPNVNLQGRCGAALTGMVSIVRDGATLLEEFPFEDLNCHERQVFVRTIELHGDGRSPVIISEPHANH